MYLPSGKNVTKDTPIYPGSNFTWGEATKDCTRKLEDLVIGGKVQVTAIAIEQKIIQTAKNLDLDRATLGNHPVIINSWYRPKVVNRSVGGSKFSRHQYGDAVDMRSTVLTPRQIYNKLEPTHSKGGMCCYNNFVHKDDRGWRSRW